MEQASEQKMRETLAGMAPDQVMDVFQKMGWRRAGEPPLSPGETARIIDEAMENCVASPGFAQLFTQALGLTTAEEGVTETTVANVETDVESAYEAERAKRRAAARNHKIWWLVVALVILVVLILIIF